MHKITLNLLENGLDFLCEALTPIVETHNDRKLKYSVLHICAGVELILKKIVFDINWQWIFLKEDEVSEEALKTGKFKSINIDKLKKRLIDCGIDISTELSHFEALKFKRNIYEHYAMLHESATQLRGNISIVLSDILGIIQRFIPNQTEAEKRIYLEVKRKAAKYQEFTDQLLERLTSELGVKKGEGALIIQCPNCFQNTLAAYQEERVECVFCHYEAEPDKCADDYLENIEGFDYYSLKDGGDYPSFECPECHRDALIRKKDGTYFCFSCFKEWDWEELRECSLCGEQYTITEDDFGICPSCIDKRTKGDDD